MIKCTAIFVLMASLSNAAMAQTPYYSVECLYEWTLHCERLKMEEERAHREEMLQEMKRQNRILQQQADQEEEAFLWRKLN